MPDRHRNISRCFRALISVGALAGASTILLAASPLLPTASASTHAVHWHKSVRKGSTADGGFSAVSCASVNLCVAVDGVGQVVWSRSPMSSSAKRWPMAKVDTSGGGLTGISCPSTHFCVAVDASGRIVWSKDPAGGAKHWTKPARIDRAREPAPGAGYVGIAGVSCPSTTLCVAVDNSPSGAVLVSTDPTGGASTWHRATIASGQQLTSVSCASTSLCVAVGTERYYATDVRAAAGDWHAAGGAPGSGVFSGIGCANGTLACVAVGYDSSSSGLASATAKASGGSWSNSSVESRPPGPSEGLIAGVACPFSGFCVAIDSNDNAYATNSPLAGGWSAPHAVRPGSASTFAAISCTARICVVVDNRGVITSASVTS